MRSVLFVVILAAFVVRVATAQEVSLVPRFEEDQVDRYRLDATLRLEQTGEFAAPARTMKMGVNLRLRTPSVNREGGAIISCVIEEAEIELDEEGDQGRHEAFVWPREEDEGDVDESSIVRAWKPLASSVIRFHVDASGHVRDVELAIEPEGEARALLGLMSPNVLGTTVAPIWGVDTSGKARRTGDTWEDSTRMVVSGQRVVQRATAYTLDAIEGDVARVKASIEYTAPLVRTESVVEASVRGTGSADVEWMATRGILASWNETSEITLETSLGEGGPGLTTHLVRTFKLTRLSDDS